MRWEIDIWMHSHDLKDGHWACIAWSFQLEHVGILERALEAGGQRFRTRKIDSGETIWVRRSVV